MDTKSVVRIQLTLIVVLPLLIGFVFGYKRIRAALASSSASKRYAKHQRQMAAEERKRRAEQERQRKIAEAEEARRWSPTTTVPSSSYSPSFFPEYEAKSYVPSYEKPAPARRSYSSSSSYTPPPDPDPGRRDPVDYSDPYVPAPEAPPVPRARHRTAAPGDLKPTVRMSDSMPAGDYYSQSYTPPTGYETPARSGRAQRTYAAVPDDSAQREAERRQINRERHEAELRKIGAMSTNPYIPERGE